VRYGSPVFGEPVGYLKNGPVAYGEPVVPVWPNYDPGQVPFAASDPFMTYIDHNAGRPPRQFMWSIGIQREITTNLSAEISYVGNRGAWWNANGTLSDPNRVTPTILKAHNLSLSEEADRTLLTTPFGLVSPGDAAAHDLVAPYDGFAGTVSQMLRPFPQFGAIFKLWAPLGRTWYDSMQLKLTKRFSHGLDFTAAYAWQREFTVGAETFDTAFATVQPAINDLNYYTNSKTLSGLSIPHRLVVAANYLVPTWNTNKFVSYILRDWQIGAVLTYASGFPIKVPVSNNKIEQQLSLCAPQSVLGGCNNSPYYPAPASVANRVKGQPLFLGVDDLNSNYDPNAQFVLNPAAWQDPAPGTFGSSSMYYNDYRYARQPNENMSLGRIFRVREGMDLQIRIELMNLFNRVRNPLPTADNALAPQIDDNGKPVAGFGYVNAINAGGQRTGQLVMRFTF